ncbi:MAG: HD-GYP domain-containing protein [Gemmatimonadetes bacterium]|nr:HD-GYP domain-containing protein [Gemmatimonadota bacterium]
MRHNALVAVNRRTKMAGVCFLARSLDAKDAYTWGHSTRVSQYSVRIARGLGLGPPWCAAVALGAELHDVGKIGVPRELLQRPGPLTPSEHRQVMQHTVIGEGMLRPVFPDHSEVLGVARWHHERVDGRGFPDGLRGEWIPLPARIVAVADAFDAMTSERPYRPPLSLDAALAELEASAGTQLDARCVDAFVREVVTGVGLTLLAPCSASPSPGGISEPADRLLRSGVMADSGPGA